MITPPDPALYWVAGAIFTALSLGTVARVIGLRHSEEARRRKRLASLRTWWILSGVVTGALLLGSPGVAVLLAAASCVAWWEFSSMLRTPRRNRPAVVAGYVLIVLHYLLVLTQPASLFVILLPLASILVVAVLLLLAGEPRDYVRSAGGLLWGMMFLGYGLSHALFPFVLPQASTGPIAAAGWFLFLVILTEANDIFQALIGRLFGAHKRHRIAPTVSPNKTWEGFLGGLSVTVVLALLLAPWLTDLGRVPGPLPLPDTLRPWIGPMVAATLIAVAGFFGDINMSAIKRDCGVKDSSKLMPGMGGLIDRVDSLTITAPVFVYFLKWWMP